MDSCYLMLRTDIREASSGEGYFFDELREYLSSVPERDLYVILGDFNARVGSGVCDADDEWRAVRGRHGLGRMNEAGEELLSFLSLFGARICNSWFCKKDIHKATWQHPRSQQWHCIDYAITRQRDARMCTDCRVYRSAECGTDHRLLCMSLSLGHRRRVYSAHRAQSNGHCRFNVAHLVDADVNMSKVEQAARIAAVDEWKHVSSEQLEQFSPNVDDSFEQQWVLLRDATVSAATAALGNQRRKQPDWYRENAHILEQVLDHRNALFQKSLRNPSAQAKDKFVRARSEARAAVRKAKNDWFVETARKAESVKFGHKRLWTNIRALQTARRGLVPVRSCTMKKLDGSTCNSVADRQSRWREHFLKVLNIPSGFLSSEIDLIQQRPVYEYLTEPPTKDDLAHAICQLSNGKAAGSSGILPEMLKVNVPLFYERLLTLVHRTWNDGTVPQEWVDAKIIPIPKKGDLSICDNWRGIALLDVVGKTVGRLLQNKLQQVAEEELPESQCGFRRGRSCTDMTFVVRQFVEKCIEHRTKGFLIFIDLRKAYDSVPRPALWIVLLKLGVPASLVKLIQSFHENMTASVIVDGSPVEGINVCNGLRQGCTMAPVLFNLYAGAVMERWSARIREKGLSGFPVRSCIDGQLFKRSKRGVDMCLTDGEFADDAVLFAPSHDDAEQMLTEFVDVATAFGLTVSIPKTVFMAVGHAVSASDCAPLPICGATVNHTDRFKYLGSLVTTDGRSHADVANRIAAASRAFGSLYSAVFHNSTLSRSTKQHVYTCCILSVLLYGSECWTLLQADVHRLERFHNRCVRVILDISRTRQWEDRLSSVTLHRMCGTEPVADMISRRRLQWLGHIRRMEDSRLPKAILFSWLPASRPACGPRKRWRDVVRDDLKALNMYDRWYDQAMDRSEWIHSISDAIADRRTSQPRQCKTFCCDTCLRSFKRVGDLTRHKCTAERQKPVCQQVGAVQCLQCDRWFASRGGLAVHRCEQGQCDPPGVTHPTPRSADRNLTCCSFHCSHCRRCFKSGSGFQRHNCNRQIKRAVDLSSLNIRCPSCPRKFRRPQDLARHKC